MPIAGPISPWVVPFFLVAGAWGIVGGLLFRFGRLRGMARYYDDPLFPYFARNIAFSLIPGGMASLLIASSAFLWSRAESVAIGLLLGGMLCAGVSWFVP